jgi:hypothetical protein
MLLAVARAALTATCRASPTVSALCLGGLIKHVASIEEGWLRFASKGRRRCSSTCPTA